MPFGVKIQCHVINSPVGNLQETQLKSSSGITVSERDVRTADGTTAGEAKEWFNVLWCFIISSCWAQTGIEEF